MIVFYIVIKYMDINILYNINEKILEDIVEKEVFDKIYFLSHRVPKIDDIKNYNKTKTNKKINEIIDKYKSYDKLINEIKDKISNIDYKIPLYDIFTENIYLINRYSVYDRVVTQNYRFPDLKLITLFKEKLEKRLNTLNHDKEKTNDVQFMRKLRKLKLMIDFVDNFNLQILEDTYVKMFYKYSPYVGKEILTCKRPSFNKYLTHITPYYNRNEIIHLALNNGLKLPNTYLDQKEVDKLCEIVKANDVTAEILLKHQKYMVESKALGLMQYYTIQGSFFLNQYLRSQTVYQNTNPFIESMIEKMFELCKNAPAFDKNYTFYRFVHDDRFLQNLKIGDIYKENGFLSTTRDPFYRSDLYKFGFILMKIKVPKDIAGIALCLETLSHFPKEQEVIFPPLSSFELIAKNEQSVYYHTDYEYGTKIKTRYEFQWVGNSETIKDFFKHKREQTKQEIKTVDFLTATSDNSMTLAESIKKFVGRYPNNQSQFYVMIGDKKYLSIAEKYDSTGAYEPFYAAKTKEGFSIYSYHNEDLLFMLELEETEEGKKILHVNFISKYNAPALDRETILNESDFLTFIASIANYFKIDFTIIYAEYKICDANSNKSINQRSFKDNNDNTIIVDDESVAVGNYCVDYYYYLKSGKRRYDGKNVLNLELKPAFSYYELDTLRNMTPIEILKQDDQDELYQIYKKTYLQLKLGNDIASFIVWIIENKCYLIDILLAKVDRIFKSENPFKYAYYIFYHYTYLYNRKLISVYPLAFDYELKKMTNENVQLNKYRLAR